MRYLEINYMLYYLLGALLFFLPSYLLRFKIFGLPTNFLEILIFFTFFIFLFLQIRNKRIHQLSNQYLKLLKDRPFFYGIVFILIGIILSSIFAQNKIAAFGVVKGWFIAPFIFFLTLLGYFNDVVREQKEKKIKFFMISLASSGLMYLTFFAFEPVFKVIYKLKDDFVTFDNRLKLFFDSPNQLAMALVPIIFASFALYFNQKNIIKRMAYFNLMLIFIILLSLTKSLGAILAVLSAFLIYYIIAKINTKYLITTLYFLLFLCALFPAMVTFIYGQPAINDRSSFASRIMIWQSAQSILADNFVLGVGASNFQDKYLQYQKKFPDYLEWAVPHPHNTFLTFWTSGGVLALIGFLILIFWIITNISNFILNNNNLSAHTLYLILYTLYFLIHSSVDTLYFKNDLSVLFWFFIALIVLQKNNNNIIIKTQNSS